MGSSAGFAGGAGFGATTAGFAAPGAGFAVAVSAVGALGFGAVGRLWCV